MVFFHKMLDKVMQNKFCCLSIYTTLICCVCWGTLLILLVLFGKHGILHLSPFLNPILFFFNSLAIIGVIFGYIALRNIDKRSKYLIIAQISIAGNIVFIIISLFSTLIWLNLVGGLGPS